MSELPWDLLEEILCRVPAAPLKRFRATCKRWNRLFNDRRFTRKHFDKATKQSLFIVLKECSIMRTNLHSVSPETLSLTDLHSSLDQVEIRRVFHCDGLLLCVPKEHNTRLVVWNPCTGQTKWIDRREDYARYALGSYQDKKSNEISNKILSHMSDWNDNNKVFEIYEINSNSWRILNVTIDFSFLGFDCGQSLKGKTYWIAADVKESKFLLVSFDYSTEGFERLCLPPRQYPSYQYVSLSVVREEKLSMLLQRDCISKTEIWVTNKIGNETKVVSWGMVLAVDLGPGLRIWHDGSFWIDEQKKVLVCCDNTVCMSYHKGRYKKIHIVGEDNKVRTEDLEFGSFTFLPVLFNYVPSLIRI